MENKSKARWFNPPFKITIVYVLIGSLWVILSDQIVNKLNLPDAIAIHSSKGLFYVLTTALILYFWAKRLKKALTESEERCRILVEHSPEPVLVHIQGKIVFINPAGIRVFGATDLEQLMGQDVMHFVHENFIDISRTRMCQVMNERKATDPIDMKFLRLDGQGFDVEVRGVPIVFLGKPAVQLICRDISERKQAERILEEREQSYKSLVDHNPDAIFSLDLNGYMQHSNPVTEKILGYQKEELHNQSFIHYIVAPDQEKTVHQFEKSVKGESNNIEIAFTHKDGTSVEVNLKLVPIIVNDEIDGVYGIAKDLTERKRTEELLLKSEKLSVVGQLAAGVAHEIRNPLTSLRGFVQLLQTRVEGYTEFFQIMLTELDRINDIVSEFMVIAKPQVVNFEMKDIRKTLHDVISLLDTQAILSNVQILTEITEDELPLIKCEENQLKQVFINILKNAIEAMTDGGNIVIQMKVEDKMLLLRFIDEGCGISEERLPMLGEPFYTTKEKGTGLGLMVCHKIIEAHSGTLHISSQIDKGTTVDLILPI